MFDLGEKRPVPERNQPRVRQIELLGHSRRQITLWPVFVVVTHGPTLAPRLPRRANLAEFVSYYPATELRAARSFSGIGRLPQSSVDTTT
ncbi:hypothetical protein MMAGJ_65650 [Mycolicibacterium mageritense]|uniref:Uncharacterized protein n=1 Tax=Mycolicibacterium mageritense TaxID=53462 RepID=A0ABM7I309_MYCME|nr:hypothetical protein MMAGJ_65650 [Mycolicibacterium mageritense]GJJ19185.1 hypothetical protein MTY414_28580 [Mycolicibacterium mageritense]